MKIIELSKNEYKGYELEYKYITKFYYDVVIKKKKAITITLKKKKLRKKMEKKFVDKLFEDYIEAPDVFGIFDKKKLIAVIECSLESWNNRYRIYNLLVDPRYRKMGYGTALFKHAEEVATKKNARAIVLETQSCNDPAINFYMKQGLHFIGLDTMCYTNKDIDQKEVRLEFGKRL
jgi:ribosomal protein S18 acetylase RimI-like enzyme